jgi:hypothetical protein
MTVLHRGNAEPLKACVHGVALGTAALCALYNLAAWLERRQRHLAVNAVLYGAVTVWEYHHVRRHLEARAEARAERAKAEPARLARVR